MVRFTLAITNELNDWLERQAKINMRSKHKHIYFLLEQAKRDTDKPRYILNHSGLCHNGTHCFRVLEPATNQMCNCDMYTYGELCR